MKKLLVITFICLLLFSCSKDDPQELFIKTTDLALYPEEAIQIDAVSDFDITYLSSNPYLVDVSAEGMLRANKVGKTRVEVSSHEHVVEIAVEVKGRYNVYPDPITDWGMSRSDLIEIAGEPDASPSNTVIEYHDFSDKAPSVMYLFSPEGSLVNSLVNVLAIYSADLIKHLDERFVFKSEENGLRIYRNALQNEDATMLIGFGFFGGDYIMLSYVAYDYSEKESAQAIATNFKTMRKTDEATCQ